MLDIKKYKGQKLAKTMIKCLLSIKNVLRVQMLDGKKNVGSIKFGCILLKTANLGQVEEEFAPGAILQAKEQLFGVLEGVKHLHNEFIVDVLKNSPLIHCMLILITLQDFCLLENLECKALLGVCLLDKEHLAVGAFADHRQLLEVSDCQFTASHLLLLHHQLLVLLHMGLIVL